MTLPAGTRLGPYEIRGLLGAGGMGEVYRARDSKLAREVAVKVLPAELSEDARRLQRFEKEARTASALNHPNIVTVYEIGAVDGTSFIAMELVEGKTLRQILSAGPLSLKKLLSIGAQAADGLAKAHTAGIVHRDLKPENLMVTRDGFVKILDFGLAKLVGVGFEGSEGAERSTMTRVTEAGTVLGTVGYMSPEQASGEPADFRSDQFSLGSILYEAATGKRAFERSTDAQTLSAIIESDPEPLETAAPRLPANLSWVVERCLAKDPDDRYDSTKDLARDLALLRDRSSAASGAGIAPPERRRVRISRAAMAGGALGVLGIGVLSFLGGARLQARRDRAAPPPHSTILTFRRGFLTGARFAPDGQTIVYSAAWEGLPSEIFTARVGSPESRRLGISEAAILAVSPTGEMALSVGCDAPASNCLGTLARVPLAGGAPREIMDGVNFADWSPDGKDLAVVRFVDGRSQVEYPIGKVLYRSSPIGFLSSIRVSPGGDLVAFLDHPRRESDRAALTVVDRAGRKRVPTTEWARLGPILWSPTGEEVFFSEWDRGKTRGARLSGSTRSASWLPGLDDVSRAGLFLDAGKRHENRRGIVLALVPGAEKERNLSWLGGSVAADLSRDGKQLLLYEESRSPDRPDEVFTTYLRPTDGSDAKLLGEGRALALSPDEEWALVARPFPEPHLVLLPTGAGEPRRLEGGGLMYRRATFFADGQRILFNADAVLSDVRAYLQDLAGGPPKRIGGEGVLPIIVSPDGRRVAALSEKGPQLLEIDGEAPPQPVSGGRPADWPLRWSDDGAAIYVFDPDAPAMVIERLDLATGRRDPWKTLAPPDMSGFVGYGTRPVGSGFSITPDGRFYAYTYFNEQSRLTLSEVGPNWWK